MLKGCIIEVSPDARIAHKAAMLSVWDKSVQQAGGTLAAASTTARDAGGSTHRPARAATHLLVGDEALHGSQTQFRKLQKQQQHLVHFSWLTSSLAKGRRLGEADFAPAALAAAAAAADSDGHDGECQHAATHAEARQSSGCSGAKLRPTPAAVAAAAAASAEAAAAGRPPPLRQLAVRSPMLTAADVQQLLLHLLSDAPRPHWLSIHGRPTTTLVVELPGLDPELLSERPALMPRLQAAARQQVLLQSPVAMPVASQTTAALVAVAGSKPSGSAGKKRKQPESGGGPTAQEQSRQQQQQQQQQQAAGASAASLAQGAFPPSFYCTTAHQMRVLGYPPGCTEAAAAAEAEHAAAAAAGHAGLPANTAAGEAVAPALPPGYVSTSQSVEVSGDTANSAAEECKQQEMVAVDCEMVITAQGFELARVTLVDGAGRLLLDELVVPDNPVTNYNTQYSGITAGMLAGVTTSVADAQRLVLRHVGPRTLLVGHTLENDLKALRMAHGRCVDTAVLFPHPRGLPYRGSLRVLAQRLLGRAIQQGAHDSHVDAEVALQAVQLKFRHGPAFGTLKDGSRHLFEVLAGRGRQLAMVAPREALMLHAVPGQHAVPAGSDREAVHAALRLLGTEPSVAAAAAGTAGGFDVDPAGQNGASGASPGKQDRQEKQEQGRQPSHVQQQQQQQPLVSPPLQQQGRQQVGWHGRPPDLLWVQLGELWAHLEGSAALAARQGGAPDFAAVLETAERDARARSILSAADHLLGELAAAMPPGSVLIVLSGQGNTPLCRVLQGEGIRRDERHRASAWRAAAKASPAVQALAQRAQRGVCMLAWPWPTRK